MWNQHNAKRRKLSPSEVEKPVEQAYSESAHQQFIKHLKSKIPLGHLPEPETRFTRLSTGVYCTVNKENQSIERYYKILGQFPVSDKQSPPLNELESLAKLNQEKNEYVIKIYGLVYEIAQVSRPVFGYSMERAEGDLCDAWYAKTFSCKTTEKYLSEFTSLCKGLKYIHSQGILHLDVSPYNILLFISESGVCSLKFADFEFSKKTDGDLAIKDLSDMRGTQLYMAPGMFFRFAHQSRQNVYLQRHGITREKAEESWNHYCEANDVVGLLRVFLAMLDRFEAKSIAQPTDPFYYMPGFDPRCDWPELTPEETSGMILTHRYQMAPKRRRPVHALDGQRTSDLHNTVLTAYKNQCLDDKSHLNSIQDMIQRTHEKIRDEDAEAFLEKTKEGRNAPIAFLYT